MAKNHVHGEGTIYSDIMKKLYKLLSAQVVTRREPPIETT